MMREFFTDLHVHVGMTDLGHWVKMASSPKLTVRNILDEAAQRKGMQILGIVDAMSPLVHADLERLLAEGLLVADTSGGYHYGNDVTLLLGAEIETTEENGGIAHTLLYLPDINNMRNFTAYMQKFIRNINLSSQNAHMNLSKLVNIAQEFAGLIIPAHVFTPYKSIYGTCTDRLAKILSDKQLDAIAALEIGLSADSDMADRIAEICPFTLISNSDAHSLSKIGREYNKMRLAAPNFTEVRYALARRHERAVVANYGLDPVLGKYHRTMCLLCGFILPEGHRTNICPQCGNNKVLIGVLDRINHIADYSVPKHPAYRALYYYQVPLEFIPGVGKKTIIKLVSRFKSEMNVMHQAQYDDLAEIAGEKIAQQILQIRKGKVAITAGGGGVYGKLLT
jgi:uncharacterized protein (TIGR00375 family)